MKATQLKEIISNGETINVEFKESQQQLNQSGFETIVAFLNTIGGFLILGVDDNRKIIGINEDKVSEIKIQFANQVNNPEKIDPPIPLMLSEVYIENKLVLYVHVPASSEVHRLKKKRIFYRTNEGDRDITDNKLFVKKLYFRKSGRKSEDIVFPELTYEDFDEQTIAYYKKTVVNVNQNLSNKQILSQPLFYKTDLETGDKGYSLATLLLFGKKEVITAKLPFYKVDVIVRYNNFERYDDRLICDENLIESYQTLLNFINRNVSHPFFYDSENNVTKDVVNIIIRELVSNILIHREFYDDGPVKIYIYKDKIIAENPNLSHNLTQISIDNFEPYSKNPVIAKVFRSLGYADELGSGFKIISDMCSDYIGSLPIITDAEQFKIEIPLLSKQQTDYNNRNYKNLILNYLKDNSRITNKETRNLLNCEKTKAGQILSEMVDNDLICRHGNGPTTYYDFNSDEN